jgi:hypothetical protein
MRRSVFSNLAYIALAKEQKIETPAEKLAEMEAAISEEETAALDREIEALFQEFLDLLGRVLSKDTDIEQGLGIIRSFWPEDKPPLYLHWRAADGGGRTFFETVTSYLESRKAWSELLSLLIPQMQRAYFDNSTELYKQLMEKVEHVSDLVDDPYMANGVRFSLKFQRAVEKKDNGECEAALQLFGEALEDARHAEYPPSTIAQIYQQIGECQMLLGEYEAASQSLKAGEKALDEITDEDLRSFAKLRFQILGGAQREKIDEQLKVKEEQGRVKQEVEEEQAQNIIIEGKRDLLLIAHSKSEYQSKIERLNSQPSISEKSAELDKINVIPSASVTASDLTFLFRAGGGESVLVGDYVVVTDKDKKVFGQLTDRELVGENALDFRGTMLGDVSVSPPYDVLHDSVDSRFFTGGKIELASPWLLRQYASGINSAYEPVDVGTLSQVYMQPPIKVALNHKGFGQHTSLFGQSGSGKSFALGRLLEELLRTTNFRIVVLDPNSDYRNISATESLDEVKKLWRNAAAFEEGSEEERKGVPEVAQDYEAYQNWLARNRETISVFTDSKFAKAQAAEGIRPIKIRLSNVNVDYQARMLHLDPQLHPDELQVYKDLIEELREDEYDLEDVIKLATKRSLSHPFMQRILLRLRSAGLESLSIWQTGDEQKNDGNHLSVVDELKRDGWRLLELDIGELKPIEKKLVSLAMLDSLWQQRERCVEQPTLVVIDEAHHLVPRDPQFTKAEATTDIINEIAGEGRKYGIFLIVVSQSPSKLHPFTLSQCSNMFLMKMNYESDLSVLRDAFSQVPKRMIDQAKGFRLGEALVIGDKLVKSPVRFRFAVRRSKEGQKKVKIPGIPRKQGSS